MGPQPRDFPFHLTADVQGEREALGLRESAGFMPQGEPGPHPRQAKSSGTSVWLPGMSGRAQAPGLTSPPCRLPSPDLEAEEGRTVPLVGLRGGSHCSAPHTAPCRLYVDLAKSVLLLLSRKRGGGASAGSNRGQRLQHPGPHLFLQPLRVHHLLSPAQPSFPHLNACDPCPSPSGVPKPGQGLRHAHGR